MRCKTQAAALAGDIIAQLQYLTITSAVVARARPQLVGHQNDDGDGKRDLQRQGGAGRAWGGGIPRSTMAATAAQQANRGEQEGKASIMAGSVTRRHLASGAACTSGVRQGAAAPPSGGGGGAGSARKLAASRVAPRHPALASATDRKPIRAPTALFRGPAILNRAQAPLACRQADEEQEGTLLKQNSRLPTIATPARGGSGSALRRCGRFFPPFLHSARFSCPTPGTHSCVVPSFCVKCCAGMVEEWELQRRMSGSS